MLNVKQNEIRALIALAGVGQDGTDIHLSFETEAEATKVFEHICEIGGYAYFDHLLRAFGIGIVVGALVCAIVGLVL